MVNIRRADPEIPKTPSRNFYLTLSALPSTIGTSQNDGLKRRWKKIKELERRNEAENEMKEKKER